MPREAEPCAEPVYDSQRLEKLAHRIGRPAVVVEERDAAQEVVSGDEQPALGLEQADVGGRVAGGFVNHPAADVRFDLYSTHQVAIGLDRLRDPGRDLLHLLRIAAKRRLGNARLAAYLDPARKCALWIGGGLDRMSVVGMHPQLTI